MLCSNPRQSFLHWCSQRHHHLHHLHNVSIHYWSVKYLQILQQSTSHWWSCFRSRRLAALLMQAGSRIFMSYMTRPKSSKLMAEYRVKSLKIMLWKHIAGSKDNATREIYIHQLYVTMIQDGNSNKNNSMVTRITTTYNCRHHHHHSRLRHSCCHLHLQKQVGQSFMIVWLTYCFNLYLDTHNVRQTLIK